jgi:hypothetical protein
MPTFLPSAHSYGRADVQHSVIVSDGKGQFLVRSNGRIEVKSGYSNIGKIYTPGDPAHSQMVKALSAVGGNRAKMQAVLDPAVFNKALNAPVVLTPSGTTATAADVAEGQVVIPFYKRSWFIPAAVGTSALAAIGLIIFKR